MLVIFYTKKKLTLTEPKIQELRSTPELKGYFVINRISDNEESIQIAPSLLTVNFFFCVSLRLSLLVIQVEVNFLVFGYL